jgi:activating signal cointegrator 1
MKVISLLQPWASLYVLGRKKIETRSWNTKHRGELLVHASAGKKAQAKALMMDFQQEFPNLQLPKYETLPFGAIIGKVDLIHTVESMFCFEGNEIELANYNTDCVNGLYPARKWQITKQELAFGDYSPNRYGWLTSNPVAFPKPIAAKGKLSIWDYQFEGKNDNHILQCTACGYSACIDAFPVHKMSIDTDQEEWDTWCPNCEGMELQLIIDRLS